MLHLFIFLELPIIISLIIPFKLQSLAAVNKVKFGSKEICIPESAIETLKTQILVTTWIVKKTYTNLVSNKLEYQGIHVASLSRKGKMYNCSDVYNISASLLDSWLGYICLSFPRGHKVKHTRV